MSVDELTLFELGPFVSPPPAGSIAADFAAFHEHNRWVYDALVTMAYRLRNSGHDRIGIGMLFEVLRWQWYTTTSTLGDYKLNNNYRSRYARLIMECEPGLAGVFETRSLSAP